MRPLMAGCRQPTAAGQTAAVAQFAKLRCEQPYLLTRVGQEWFPSASISTHRLRHTTATQLLNAGCPVTSIQKLLGHKKLNTTMVEGTALQECNRSAQPRPSTEQRSATTTLCSWDKKQSISLLQFLPSLPLSCPG